MRQINYHYITVLIALLAFLITIILLTGCAVTAYHHDYFADGKQAESVEVWQGQLLFPSEYKNGSFSLSDGTKATIGQSKRWPDPNSIEAATEAVLEATELFLTKGIK